MDRRATTSSSSGSIASDDSAGLAREHPEERNRALRLDGLDELVSKDLEAGPAQERAIRVGVEAAEEHGHAEPVARPVRKVADPERREEEPVGLEPPAHPPKDKLVLFARDVGDRVESRDRRERRGREAH